MRILFIHLSDFHIKQSDHVEIVKIEKIAQALNTVGGFDECIIILSGDIASTGNENEYKRMKYFIGNLFKYIRSIYSFEKFLHVLVVPGNHDASFDNVTRTGRDIQEYYVQGTINEHLEQEFSMFKNFYDYSEISFCFKYDKICDKRFITLGDYVIQANLINTALFSTLSPEDKQLHYFPNEKLSILRRHPSANIAITIMHHNLEWFNWEYKNNLEKVIYNDSTILFLGHDHTLNTKDLNVNNLLDIFISAGGEYKGKDIIGTCEFNSILLDTSDNTISSFSFIWSKDDCMFTHNKLFEKRNIAQNNYIIKPNIIFLEYLKEDQKRKVSKDFTQYFIFPSLSEKAGGSYTEKADINSFEDFLIEMNKNKYINIVGGENAGKTSLLKMLYLNLINKMVPILFTTDDIKDKNISKVVKILFEEQYSDRPIDYEKFLQLDKKYKIAIIDDFDLIKKEKVKRDLVEFLREFFEYIIVTSKNYEEFDIINNVRNQINEKNEFCIYKINNFYLKKRQDLIKNVCKVCKPMNDEDINKVILAINGFIKHQFQLFDLDPDFIIQFTQYYLQSSGFQTSKNESIFSKIFETNIYNALIQNAKSEDSVDEMITALEEVAYYIHFNKKDPLQISELQSVIAKYNEDFSVSVNSKALVDACIKSKILKYTDDGFTVRFSNKNHLAFFVAKCLTRNYNYTGSLDDITYVLQNICFGINDNIILFISYLTSNPRIIQLILRAANSLMHDWEEINFDSGNIKYISKSISNHEVKAPQKGEREKVDAIENQKEREAKETELIECKGLYDYDESVIDLTPYKLARAIKYTEMISKALPNFSNILRKDSKIEILQGIYSFPNKILYKLLKPIDDNYEQIIRSISEFSASIKATGEKGALITSDEIETMFYSQTYSMILGLYNYFAFLTADRRSIDLIDSFSIESSNHSIFNLMVSENYGNTDTFSCKADAIYDISKNPNIKYMIRRIVRKHLIYSETIKFNKRQQIVDKYFGKGEQRAFLVESRKERTI